MNGWRLAAVCLVAGAVTVGAAGCGGASSAVGHTVPSLPAPTVVQSPVTPAPGPAATTVPAAGTAPAGAGSAVAADLSAVASDEQDVDAGTNQSDTDFQAGTSAQSQTDQP